MLGRVAVGCRGDRIQGLGTALGAHPEDGDVFELGVEAVILLQVAPQRLEGRRVYVGDRATLAAHEVMVVGLANRMINKSAAAEISLSRETLLLQQFQRPVDGRDVDVGVLLPGPGVDLLGADVIIAGLDGFQYHHALRRQAKPSLLKCLEQVFVCLHIGQQGVDRVSLLLHFNPLSTSTSMFSLLSPGGLTKRLKGAMFVVETSFHLQLRMVFTEKSVRRALRRRGYKLTPQRRAVLKTIADSSDHLTPAEIHEKARANYSGVGLVTVYRTLEILEDMGLLCQVHSTAGCRSYLLRRPSEHHHHLVCVECGKVDDFSNCDLSELAEELARETGFKIEGHILEFSGRCSTCQRTAGPGHDRRN